MKLNDFEITVLFDFYSRNMSPKKEKEFWEEVESDASNKEIVLGFLDICRELKENSGYITLPMVESHFRVSRAMLKNELALSGVIGRGFKK